MSEPGTPLPWSLSDYGRIIENAKGDALVMDRGMTEANAVYIVEACNAYPHLVAALRKLVDAACLDGCPFKQNAACLPCGRCTTCHKTGAAIAEAERLLNESEGE